METSKMEHKNHKEDGKMTQTQAQLWKVADAEIRNMGGIGRITRNPDVAIRQAAKTQGTREWALIEATRLASPAMDDIMTDEYCDRLLNLIQGVK